MRIVSLHISTVKAALSEQRFLSGAGLSLAVVILAIASSQFVARRSAAHSLTGAQGQGCCSNTPGSLRRMIGTFYTTENNFASTLILNNKGPNQIAVTPILHSLAGQSYNGSPVMVAGESSLEVDLNALALNAGPQFRSGSFEFTYTGRMLEMGGGLRIVDAARSLIFDEQLLEPGMKFSSAQLEAVYALPSAAARVSVIVSNTTAQPLSVSGDATFAGINGHHPVTHTLQARETRRVELPPGLLRRTGAGAVSLSHNGEPGALLAMIHVQDEDKGFSAAVNFTDPAQGKTSEWHGAGLRLGNVFGDALKPVIVVRNTGSSATTVAARVPYSKQDGDTGTIALPPVSLAPGEIRLLDTSNPQLLLPDYETAGLELEYTGAPGSVIASALSVSQSGNHVFTLPLKDPQGGLSSTGGYPWFISGSASTVVFIKNTTSEPQQFHLDVVYQGGRWGSNLKTLAPGETFLLDVKKIRDAQEPGSEGNTIPPDVTVGHVSWSVRGRQNKTLIGRAQTADLVNGLSSTYECQCQCPASFGESRLLPSSIVGFIGDSLLATPEERDINCFGQYGAWYGIGPHSVSFWSDNTSVGTINSSGQTTAVGAGSTYFHASWETPNWIGDPLLGCLNNPGNTECYTSCTVQEITVNWSAPQGLGVPLKNGTAPQGSPPYVNSITLSASSNSQGGTWSWTTNSNKVTLENSSTDTLTVRSVTKSAQKDDVPITLTYTYNGSTYTNNNIKLTVQEPESFAFVQTTSNEAATCSSGQSGWRKVMLWQLKDHLGNDMALALPCWDTVNNNTPNSCSVPAQGEGTAPGFTTGTNGRWNHTYTLCSTACQNGGSCEVTGNQNFTVNGYSVSLPFTMKCNSITVAGQ